MKGFKKTFQHCLTHAQTHIFWNTTVLNQTKAQDFLIIYHLKQEDDLINMHTVKTCSAYTFFWKCRTVKGDHLKFK